MTSETSGNAVGYAADRFRCGEFLVERLDDGVVLLAESHKTRKARFTEAESRNTLPSLDPRAQDLFPS